MTGNVDGATTFTTEPIGCYDVCRLEGGELVFNDRGWNYQAFFRGFITEEIAPGFHCYFEHDEN